MAIIIRSFILILALTLNATAFANDLEKFAKEVPTVEIDNEMLVLVQKEIGPDITVVSSHYSLAFFTDTNESPHHSWYLLDGYLVLSNKQIVMLDFVYNPKTKSKRPRENYNGSYDLLLLGSKYICNPYERFWLASPYTEISRSLPGEDGIDQFYTNVKDCTH